MEADLGAELVNNSKILKETWIDVRVVIGDEDSSTIANIRKGNRNTIYKLSDRSFTANTKGTAFVRFWY